MELMDATWRPLFLLCNNGSCFFCLYPLTKTKLILRYYIIGKTKCERYKKRNAIIRV